MPYEDVPFFWTKCFDLAIRDVGHAREDAAVRIDGHALDRDATVSFERDGRVGAVATIGRDRVALAEERRREKPERREGAGA